MLPFVDTYRVARRRRSNNIQRVHDVTKTAVTVAKNGAVFHEGRPPASTRNSIEKAHTAPAAKARRRRPSSFPDFELPALRNLISRRSNKSSERSMEVGPRFIQMARSVAMERAPAREKTFRLAESTRYSSTRSRSTPAMSNPGESRDTRPSTSRSEEHTSELQSPMYLVC